MKKLDEDESPFRPSFKKMDKQIQRSPLGRLVQPDTVGLLKPGAYSLIFHIALVVFIILSLKPGGTKGSSVYRVTLRPFSGVGSAAPQGGSGSGVRGGLATLPPVAKEKTESSKGH